MNWSRIALAVAVAGTLDIASAIIMTVSRGKSAIDMLSGIASGPFGEAMGEAGMTGAVVGLATHFAIMTVMVIVFALLVSRWAGMPRPLIAGPVYGIILYLVMYWVVMPLRWSSVHPSISVRGMLIPVAIHIVLVGLPIALILCRPAARGGETGAAAPEASEAI